jgi:arylsulfatase A-like enzyme
MTSALLRRALLAVAAAAVPCAVVAQPAPTKPRLVVMLTVDQLRPDYLTTWRDQFTGGYKRILDESAFFFNGYQDHANTETAPGHAATLSGRYPVSTGIAANAIGVETNDVPLIVYPGQGASPFRFKGTTLADWMQAVDPRTRVLSVARKDRGAILPVASNPTHTVLWYAPRAGTFTTSVHYGDTLPTFAQRFNAERPVLTLAGSVWTPLLAPSVYAADKTVPGLPTFPHTLPTDSMRAAAMITTFPWMDSLTVALALRGAEAMQLGRTADRTDLLAVSLSNTDGIGHKFGPDSPELHDHVIRVDRYLGMFFDVLDATVGKDNYVLVLTADHGATPPPEVASRWEDNRASVRIPSAAFRPIFSAARARLAAQGVDSLAIRWSDQAIWLDTARLAGRRVDFEPILAEFTASVKTIDGVWRVDRLVDLAAADTSVDYVARRTLRMFRPGEDAVPGSQVLLVVTTTPNSVIGTGDPGRHGAVHDADARVPIAFLGAPFRPGMQQGKVAVVDIAPTLADLLGVKPLEAVDGRVVREARR